MIVLYSRDIEGTNQAQKCLQVDPKRFHQIATDFLKIYSTDYSTACLPACLIPSVKRSGKLATATALVLLQKHF